MGCFENVLIIANLSFLHNENTHENFPISLRVLWLLPFFLEMHLVDIVQGLGAMTLQGNSTYKFAIQRPQTKEDLFILSRPFVSLDAVFFLVFVWAVSFQGTSWAFLAPIFGVKIGGNGGGNGRKGLFCKVGMMNKKSAQIRDDGLFYLSTFLWCQTTKRKPWAQWKPEYHLFLEEREALIFLQPDSNFSRTTVCRRFVAKIG